MSEAPTMNRFITCLVFTLGATAACSAPQTAVDPNAIEVTGQGEVAADLVGSFAGTAPNGEVAQLTLKSDNTYTGTESKSCSASDSTCAAINGDYRILQDAAAAKMYLELLNSNGDMIYSFGYQVTGTQLTLADRQTLLTYTLARTN
jgi:hypothetical protein